MDATATVRIKVVVDVDDVAAMRERLRRACIEALSEDTDDTRIATLEKRVRDLESECEAKSRQIREMEHAKLADRKTIKKLHDMLLVFTVDEVRKIVEKVVE